MPEFDLPASRRIVRAVKTVENRLGLSPLRFNNMPFKFELIEDAVGSSVLAKILSIDGYAILDEVGEIVNDFDVLTGATPGYSGYCWAYGGKYYILHGPCVEVEEVATPGFITTPGNYVGSVNQALPPASVTATGDVNNFSVDGNVPGVSFTPSGTDTFDIAGTPTQAGVFVVTFSFTTPNADGTGDVTITKALTYTIT